MKRLLLIDAGDGGKNFIFDLISHQEIELFLAVPHKKDWMQSVVDEEHLIVCDIYSYDDLFQAVTTFCTEKDITLDGVGTYYDFFVTQTAQLAKHFNIPGIDEAAAGRSSANKHLMRTTCTEQGVEMPRFTLVTGATRDSLVEAVNAFGFPCVVKPIIGSKSYGVKLFTEEVSVSDIEDIFSNTDKEVKALFKNFSFDFLIEEFMSGMVVSVDGFIQNGVISFAGIIEFVMGPEPYFTQEANYIPARISDQENKQCYDYVTRVIKALEFDQCGFHCELRLTDTGPRLIEIACRLPGGPLQLGYKQAYGYNLASNLVDIWLGKETKLVKQKSTYIVQKAVYDYTPGVLMSLTGMDTLASFPFVWASAQLTPTGSKIVTYPKVPEPLYFYAIEANTPEELAMREKEAETVVTYKIEQ